jgi:hypothetical protein
MSSRRMIKSYKYDVCISFAGEDRDIAEGLANTLFKNDLKVFYDEYERLDLWGKDLYKHLYKVYSAMSRFCIILLSKSYLEKAWPNHELRAAQSRALVERREYILPC